MNEKIQKFRQGWHLDKRVPLALIFSLVSTVAVGVWYASDLSGKVSTNAQQTRDNARDIRLIRETQSIQTSQFSRIEEQIIGLRRDINRFLDEQNKGTIK